MDGDAEQLNAAGWRLLEVLRNQLADGQVETLLSLQRATAQTQQSAQALEAAAESLTRDVTDRITAVGESLIRLADDIWAQLSAAATRLAQDADATVLRVHELAQLAQDSTAVNIQDTVAALDSQLDASLGRAAATSELVRRDLAELLAGWESRDDARDQRLIARGDLMLAQAAERLAAETERLAVRDREQERRRAEEFARVLEDVLAQSGVRGRKVRRRVREALESEPDKGVRADALPGAPVAVPSAPTGSLRPPLPPPIAPPPLPPPPVPERARPAETKPALAPETEDEPWTMVVTPSDRPKPSSAVLPAPSRPASRNAAVKRTPNRSVPAKPIPAKPNLGKPVPGKPNLGKPVPGTSPPAPRKRTPSAKEIP